MGSYLLHGELYGRLAVGEFCLDARSLDLRHHIMQPLRLLQHLPVAPTEFPQHPVGDVGNALSWVTEGPPQGLQDGKTGEE